MSECKYEWRPGCRVSGLDAADAGEELERIRLESGTLTPDEVVRKAVDEDSPLHPAFEWDDSKAGHQHRLQQARGLIRAVCIVTPHDPTPTSVYVHLTTQDGGFYQPVSAVVTHDVLYRTALGELRVKLWGAKRAFDELARAKAKVGDGGKQRDIDRIGKPLAKAVEAAELAAKAA